ncbi:hypothetical protein [Planosporangium mesophilum]|nr:hypothetical protein [Planosporangium mesophilum]NJC85937.1 hypothetical protein [Planosporangium mesophilum]
MNEQIEYIGDDHAGSERAGRTRVLVPGVGGHAAAEILDPPQVRPVAGDGDAGFYRRSAPEHSAPEHSAPEGTDAGPGRTEAYSWAGLTSGNWTRALWLLLLPFMLANVGYWMGPAPLPDEEGTGGRRQRLQRTVEALQRLLALSLTAVLVVAATAVAMDLAGSQCVVDGRACNSTLSFLAWPWLTAPRRLVLTAAVPVALVLLLWWLGNRTWQQMESVPVPAATSIGALTPLEDRRMWNGRRSVRMLRAIHVAAAFAVIAVFLAAGSLATPARGLPSVINPDEWRRPWGWPVVTVLTVSLALLAALTVAVLLPMMGRRDRPGDAVRPHPFEEPLYRWLPWFGGALVVLAAVAALRPAGSAARTAGHPTPLPWLSGTVNLLFVGQAAVTIVLTACLWLSRRAAARPPAARPAWHGMAPVVTAGLAWLLADGLMTGVTLLVADRLGTPEPPPDGAGNHQGLVVAPTVLWTAVTAVGVAAVVLITAAIWLVVRRSPAESIADRVRQAYRYENLESAPPGSPRQRRAQAIIRDWSRGAMIDNLERHGGRLAAAVAVVVTTAVIADLATPSGIFAHSWRWAVALGAWLLGGLVLVLLSIGRQAYSSPGWRRTVGVLWDVGTFWPRATHPLAPPCYAERAVPDLLTRVTYLAGTWERAEEEAGWGPPPRDGQVLLAGHSQGSVITAAAVMQLSAETSGHVRLLTYGSPLRQLYARFFPSYLGAEALYRLSELLGATSATDGIRSDDLAAARWRNLYRPSDPIGGYVLEDRRPSEWPDEAQRRRADREQIEHHIDCALLDPSFGRAPGDTRYPPTYGHSAYPRDPAFALAMAWLWRQGPGGHDSNAESERPGAGAAGT